jgi:DNA-binding MarR family transcriptional regulator
MAITIRTNETTEAWRALLVAHARVNRILDDELRRETGLNLGWYEVLLLLAGAPDQRLRMSDLAAGMILSRSAATRLVDRLERDGLVERSVCDEDRRGMEVSLTDEGRDRFLVAGRLHLRGIEQHFGAHLDPTELEVLTEALTRVAEANR